MSSVKYAESYSVGLSAEKRFASLFKNYSFSNEKENMFEHWDVKVILNVDENTDVKINIDVKSLRKTRRSDLDVNENIHYVEIKNVNGKTGWLYGDKVQYFAFELKKYWVIVKKEDLQEFIKTKTEKIYVERPELYKLYRRKGRKDIITMVQSYDLCYLSSIIIEKENEQQV